MATKTKKTTSKPRNRTTSKPTKTPTPVTPVNVFTAFPTYVLSRQWEGVEAFNTAMIHEIMKKRIKDPEGIYRSNASGTWHSDTKLMQWSGKAGKQLVQMYGKAFNQYCDVMGGKKGGEYSVQMSAWAMMYADRGYATVHTHPNCHFSGVYYLNEGDDRDLVMVTNARVRTGELEFVDTRGQAGHQVQGLLMQPTLRIAPKPGLMVIFPQWLPHFVHPVEGERDRISIACNATIKYVPPKEEDKKKDGSD